MYDYRSRCAGDRGQAAVTASGGPVAEKGQEKTAVTEVFEVGRQRFEWFPFPTALSPTVTEHPFTTGVGYDTGRGTEELAEPKNQSHQSLDAVGHLEICSLVPGSKGNDRICNKNSPQDREALQSGAAKNSPQDREALRSGAAKNSAQDREALQSGAAKNSAQDHEALQSGAGKNSAQVCEKLQSGAAKIIKEPMASQKGSAESVRASAASEKSSAKSIKAPQSLQKGLANSIKESQTSQKRSKKPLQGAQLSQKGSAKNAREPATLPKQTYLWPTISKAKEETKRTEPPAQRASVCNDHVMDVEEEPASASRGGLQESADKATEAAGSLENCPICLMPFPKQFSQLDIDSHLAQCLSETTVDVVW
ncbi:Fanconi anemia core complex-associated protein 20 isoform 2-T2 [Mantella aurantiaca]